MPGETGGIKSLEKRIRKAADVQAIKVLMNSMQHHVNMMSSGVRKTPGQCFGQNDGYIYGNFGKRLSRNRGEGFGRGSGAGGPGSFRGGPDGGPRLAPALAVQKVVLAAPVVVWTSI